MSTRKPTGRMIAERPQPGDTVLFLRHGQWERGVVAGYGDAGRLPIKREANANSNRGLIYRRKRTQIFRP